LLSYLVKLKNTIMLLHDIKKSKGYNKKSKRLGRGSSSGKGDYCTKWIKGQKARSGGKLPIWFEGGQTPLFKRLPKLKGFKRQAKLRKEYSIVNTGSLDLKDEIQDGDEITKDKLADLNLIRKQDSLVKILGKWDLSKKLTFIGIDKFSKSAKEKIKKSGGEIK